METIAKDEQRGLLDFTKIITADKNLSGKENGLTTKVPMQEKDEMANIGSSQSERSCFQNFLSTEIEDVTSVSFWRACLAEFLGTMLLCFYTIGVGLFMPDKDPPSILQAALATGFFVAVLVTSLAAVSGCHINPAVTLGFASLRYVSIIRAIAYIIFQCLGGITGSFLLKEVLHPDMVGNLGVLLPGNGITDKQATLMEVILTSFLLFVVMAVIDKARTDIQGSVPLIVGLTVCVNILMGGLVSGACMNPARALGPAVAMMDYRKQWIYWLGPCIGGLFGSLLYDRLFSAGISEQCSPTMCLCGPRSEEYSKAVKKEATKMVLELETAPEDQV